MALLSLETIRDRVRHDPSIYPQNLDLARQAVLFLLQDEAALRAASFLDDRILGAHLLGRWTPFAETAALLDGLAPQKPLHFIFHTGHVGSTLISRLLDAVDGVLGLREPLPLRVLAETYNDLDEPHSLLSPAQWQALMRFMTTCWSRGFADTRAVVVKATSSANACSAPLLSALPEVRAIALNVRPEPYLATLLAGENSPLDLRGHAQARMKRLAKLAPETSPPLHALSLGEIAAMSWTVETLTHQFTAQQFNARMTAIDFDAFLEKPDEALRRIMVHFHIDDAGAFPHGVARHALMSRYSKAPEHAYTPETRRQVLAQARARHADEIRKGLGWIESFTRRAPALGALLSA